MKIQTMKLDDITPAEYNPRKDLKPKDKKYQKIKKSIEKHGLVQPLVWNKRTKTLIGGHQRLKILKEMGEKETEVVIVDIDGFQEMAMNIALNKAQGEWDNEGLADLLKQALANDWFDETCFEEEELDDILKEIDEPLAEGETDPDEVPEERETDIKQGDIFQLGNHRLMCEDATKDTDKLMEGNKSEMVFTDPPYNVDYDTKRLGADRPMRHKKMIGDKQSQNKWKKFSNTIARIIRENNNGAVYVCHAPGPDGRIMATELDNTFHWSATIIWDKGSMVLGRADYQRSYEPMWYGWYDKHFKNNDRTQTDVWIFSKPVKNDLHPTMKPVELVIQAITNSSRKGDAVLDLFGGSGSTLIACEQTGRKCFMMELDPQYCQVIIDRWEQFTGKKAEKVSQ